jgi:hypothetical protein
VGRGEEEPGDGTPSDSVLEIEMTLLEGLVRIGWNSIQSFVDASGWLQLDHRQPFKYCVDTRGYVTYLVRNIFRRWSNYLVTFSLFPKGGYFYLMVIVNRYFCKIAK